MNKDLNWLLKRGKSFYNFWRNILKWWAIKSQSIGTDLKSILKFGWVWLKTTVLYEGIVRRTWWLKRFWTLFSKMSLLSQEQRRNTRWEIIIILLNLSTLLNLWLSWLSTAMNSMIWKTSAWDTTHLCLKLSISKLNTLISLNIFVAMMKFFLKKWHSLFSMKPLESIKVMASNPL